MSRIDAFKASIRYKAKRKITVFKRRFVSLSRRWLKHREFIGRFAIVLLALSPIAIVFQNCGKGFQSIGAGTLASEASGRPITVPAITFTSQTPTAYSNQKSLTFSFGADPSASNPSANSGLTFQCRFDSAVFASCSSPTTMAITSEGSHTFYVEATNSFGGTSQIAQSWTSDFTAPTVMVNTPPPSLTNSTSVSIAFTTTDALSGIASTECSLDNSAFSTCTSPFSSKNLSSGNHSLQIEAIDKAGNASTIAAASWTIDSTIPTVTITPQFTSPTKNTIASFMFTAIDNGQTLTSGFQCQLDGGPFSACASPYTTSTLVQGSHRLGVKVTNAIGTTSATATDVFVVDISPPVISNLTLPASCTQGACTNLATFSVTDNLSGVKSITCSVNGSAPIPCTSPYTISAGLTATGIQEFKVSAIDGAGNSIQDGGQWIISPALAPVINSFSASATNIQPGQSVTLTWTSSNGVSATINGAAEPVNGSMVVNPSVTTTYTLTVAGAAGATPASQSYAVPVMVGPLIPTQFVATSINSNVISVTISGNAVYVSTVNGLYASTDGGNTFTLKSTAIWNSLFADGSTLYGGTSEIEKSTDGGTTFTPLSYVSNPYNYSAPLNDSCLVNHIAQSPDYCTIFSIYASGSTIYAADADGYPTTETVSGIYSSNDGGNTFSQLYGSQNWTPTYRPNYVRNISVSNGHLYFVDGGVYATSGQNTYFDPQIYNFNLFTGAFQSGWSLSIDTSKYQGPQVIAPGRYVYVTNSGIYAAQGAGVYIAANSYPYTFTWVGKGVSSATTSLAVSNSGTIFLGTTSGLYRGQ